MDSIEGECILMMHEKALKQCDRYQKLNIELLHLENKIVLNADGEVAKLFLKYADLLSEQKIIFIDELLRI